MTGDRLRDPPVDAMTGDRLSDPPVDAMTGDGLRDPPATAVAGRDPRPDRVIARIASARHGAVTRAQLIAVGIERGAVAHRLAEHRLHPVHRGVYLVGHAGRLPLALHMAAVLACGPGAAISHESAADLWRIRPHPGSSGAIDVTIGRGRRRVHAGIRLHRHRALRPQDVRLIQGIPITAPGRTVADLAAILPMRDLERAVDEARVRGLLDDAGLSEAASQAVGCHGIDRLRAVLARDGDGAITRSEAEERLLALIRSSGLPAPLTNQRVAGYEVDVLWPAQRLIVEVDGYAFHGTRAAFERDRRRDAELQAAGYRVMRVTWRQLVDEPEATLVRIAQALCVR